MKYRVLLKHDFYEVSLFTCDLIKNRKIFLTSFATLCIKDLCFTRSHTNRLLHCSLLAFRVPQHRSVHAFHRF